MTRASTGALLALCSLAGGCAAAGEREAWPAPAVHVAAQRFTPVAIPVRPWSPPPLRRPPPGPPPLLLLNGREVTNDEMLRAIRDPDLVAEMYVFTGPEARARYGLRAAHGAVIVTTRPRVRH